MQKRSARNNNGSAETTIPKEAAEDLGLVDEQGEVRDTEELPNVVFFYDRESGEWSIDSEGER